MRIQFAGISQAWKLCFLLYIWDIWQSLQDLCVTWRSNSFGKVIHIRTWCFVILLRRSSDRDLSRFISVGSFEYKWAFGIPNAGGVSVEPNNLWVSWLLILLRENIWLVFESYLRRWWLWLESIYFRVFWVITTRLNIDKFRLTLFLNLLRFQRLSCSNKLIANGWEFRVINVFNLRRFHHSMPVGLRTRMIFLHNILNHHRSD